MLGPSVKELMEELEATMSQATLARMIMAYDLDPLDFSETRRWARTCFSQPSLVELMMSALNEVLDGHGSTWVEGSFVNGSRRKTPFITVDFGDPYIPTLAFDLLNRTFFIASVADLKDPAEEGGESHG